MFMNWILPGICDLVSEGPVAFYRINHADRPAGLIQDQPRGLFTELLCIWELDEVTSFPVQTSGAFAKTLLYVQN